jgi:hypothetical protein
LNEITSCALSIRHEICLVTRGTAP